MSRLAAGAVVVVAVLAGVLQSVSSGVSAQVAPGGWKDTPSPMATARVGHTATLLGGAACETPAPPSWCGKVLVAGGDAPNPTKSAELYDPVTGTWTATPPMNTAHSAHAAVMLRTGKVLVVDRASAELYDPSSGAAGTWAPTGSLKTPRRETPATATVVTLDDGRVLVAGGGGQGGTITESELYDPATGAWTRTGDLNVSRHEAGAVLLVGGSVLVVGGETVSTPDPDPFNPAAESAEIYNPSVGSWVLAHAPPLSRSHPGTALLVDGRVLVAGGVPRGKNKRDDIRFGTEVYDPATDQWAITASTNFDWFEASPLVRLPDGRVLSANAVQYANNSGAATGAEVYDPAANRWTPTGSLARSRIAATATLLGCRAVGGRVLVAGGLLDDGHGNQSSKTATAELFTGVPSVQEVTTPQGIPVVSSAGGDVVIKGIGLGPRGGGSVTVSFNVKGTGATGTATGTATADGTQVSVKAPALAGEGPVDIGLTVGGIKAETCTITPLVAAAPPTISGIAPPTGLAIGGQTVTVTGAGLGGKLFVDGQEVSSSPISGGLTFRTPDHAPGPVTVTVDNGIGQASTQFTYQPAVIGLSSKTGSPKGGQPLKISGKGLTGATVAMGGTLATPAGTPSDAEVDVTTPPHPPGKVTVVVTTPKGPAVPAAPGADQYEFLADPPPAGITGPGGPGAAGSPGGAGGDSHLPLGGGGTGGGAPPGGALANPSGNTAPSGGLTTTGPPVALAAPGPSGGGLGVPGGLSTSPGGPAGLVSGGPPPGSSAAGAGSAPPPPPPTAPLPVHGQAPGSAGGAGSPGGAEAEGAPRYAMVGQLRAAPALAMTMLGGVGLMLLFACLVLAASSSARSSCGVPITGRPRFQGAY